MAFSPCFFSRYGTFVLKEYEKTIANSVVELSHECRKKYSSHFLSQLFANAATLLEKSHKHAWDSACHHNNYPWTKLPIFLLSMAYCILREMRKLRIGCAIFAQDLRKLGLSFVNAQDSLPNAQYMRKTFARLHFSLYLCNICTRLQALLEEICHIYLLQI